MRILDTKWTDAQRECIRLRGETLLVSAAAGSGKTAVLTERIIDRVLDEENPLELSRVLVVTFTKAAASELKARIRAALGGELVKSPGNKWLYTQMLSVGGAKISTIDSFCLTLIRSHFAELGLSAGVSVADEAEAKLLSKNVMNELIDGCFDGTIPGLPADVIGNFADHLVGTRSADRLAEVLIGVRETVNGFEDGTEWIAQAAEAYRKTAEKGFFSGDDMLPAEKTLRSLLWDFVRDGEKTFRETLPVIESEPVFEKNYGDGFRYASAWIRALRTGLETGENYDAVRERFLAYNPPKLGSGIRGDNRTPEIDRAKERLDAFLERRKDILSGYFTMPSRDVGFLCAKQANILSVLYRVLSEFENRLKAEKARRRILDFGDMGRLALTLLWDRKKACPTPLAREESEKYDEIYIDEYQDVSPVQDRIFSSIARRDNRFMVGDAKQSIYAFRGASPELFTGYRTDFADHPEHGKTVFLSSNFRCDPHVIAFSNRIFSVLFGTCGGIPYTENDALVNAKKTDGKDTQTKVSLALIPTDRDEDENTEKTEDSSAAKNMEAYTEADYIADTVEELLRTGTLRDGTKLHPRDIAILLRSAKTTAEPIEQALLQKAIPTCNNVSRAFFENAEVLLVYSLLTVIDNPQKDVYLAGALKSPLYRVTLDELIHIRKAEEGGSLYDALCAFTEKTGFAKGKYFLEKLSYYRHLSRGMPVDRFLWTLYRDTGILSLVYRKEGLTEYGRDTDPAQMRANLMMFYEYARQFEKGTFQGLSQFVLFIGDVIEEKAKLPPVQLTAEDADAVHIMTIHQSKGLEFPVCILAGLSKTFNASDRNQSVVLDRDGGIATYLRDETGLAKIDHPGRECVRAAIEKKQTEEEMRILYVALTRAREQLYLSASVKDAEKKLAYYREHGYEKYSLYSSRTYLDWILAAFGGEDSDCLSITVPMKKTEKEETTAPQPTAPVSGISYAAAKRKIRETFSFVYPDSEKIKIPAKLSVSALSEKKEGKALEEYAVPQFLSGTSRMTAADRGTATHLFMQFCDYTALEENGIDAEITRLLKKGYIDRAAADAIDRKALADFLRSGMFARLRSARMVKRELRFNLHLPAAQALPDISPDSDAKVLVQGIIDCLFEDEDGKTVLLDYKTDHFSKDDLRVPEKVMDILRERHGRQLAYYRQAAEQILCRPIDEMRIYSFALSVDFEL